MRSRMREARGSVTLRPGAVRLTPVRTILMEFNELSPPVMQKLMAQGELPNFQRFYRESEAYTTEADELAPNLEPWIQWVTIHSGIPYREHGIQRLGDGHKLAEDNLWDVLSDHGMVETTPFAANAAFAEAVQEVFGVRH